MPIREFHGAFAFLSNFHGLGPDAERLAIFVDGVAYPTVEHAYVAAKLTDPGLRAEVLALPTAGQAKRFLRERGLSARADWLAQRLLVMEDLLRQKFSHPQLAVMLVATGEEELSEGNRWGDEFWGVDLRTGVGANHLGRLLMKIRAELAGRVDAPPVP